MMACCPDDGLGHGAESRARLLSGRGDTARRAASRAPLRGSPDRTTFSLVSQKITSERQHAAPSSYLDSFSKRARTIREGSAILLCEPICRVLKLERAHLVGEPVPSLAPDEGQNWRETQANWCPFSSCGRPGR